MVTQIEIFRDFERVTKLLPVPVYWLDINAILLGANENFYKTLGVDSSYIGTTGYDVYPYEIAHHIVEHDKYVMNRGKSSFQEEPTKDIIHGNPRWFNAFKNPIRDQNGNVVGLIGTLIEITDTKEKERLVIENEAQKLQSERQTSELEKQKLLAIIEEQEKFRKIVNQVAHDIGSPIFAINSMLHSCDALPEDERDIFRQAVDRIRDITNNLLNYYKPGQDIIDDKIQPMLVSSQISDLLSEKRFEYNNHAVNFNYKYSQGSTFAFINANQGSFKRMLSNLINNAVDAVTGKSDGQVKINLDAINNNIQICIEDNGNGMTDEVKSKILNNIAVTSGKMHGHGIGFGQVFDTLEYINGQLDIESEIGSGSRIILSFPKVTNPDWICTEIKVNKEDLIVIVDDDRSIHGAWDSRFEKLNLKGNCKHFEKGSEAVAFINALSENQKDHLLLLTDYELIKQNVSGLDIIKKTNIKCSILVTSHYNNLKVRELAKLLDTKIMPKSLASDVQITML